MTYKKPANISDSIIIKMSEAAVVLRFSLRICRRLCMSITYSVLTLVVDASVVRSFYANTAPPDSAVWSQLLWNRLTYYSLHFCVRV